MGLIERYGSGIHRLFEAYEGIGLAEPLFEMTIPDKPRSSKQKYRMTEAGRRLAVSDSSDST
jgi:ATP-dependent DNA helicase RecG